MDRWNIWTCERGGVDFVQIITAMMIIAIAAVSTTYSIYVGRLSFDEQLQEKQAIRYAREEMEYWSGRILVSPPTSQEMLGDIQGGRRILIDPRNPNDQGDNVWGRVFYARIIPVDLLLTGEETTDYYQIHVWVVWPDNVPQAQSRRVDFYSSMIQMNQ